MSVIYQHMLQIFETATRNYCKCCIMFMLNVQKCNEHLLLHYGILELKQILAMDDIHYCSLIIMVGRLLRKFINVFAVCSINCLN